MKIPAFAGMTSMNSVAVGDVAGHGLAVHFESEGIAEHRATLHGERNLLEVLHLESPTRRYRR